MQSQRERLEPMCLLDNQTAAVCAVLFKTKHEIFIHLGPSPLLTPWPLLEILSMLLSVSCLLAVLRGTLTVSGMVPSETNLSRQILNLNLKHCLKMWTRLSIFWRNFISTLSYTDLGIFILPSPSNQSPHTDQKMGLKNRAFTQTSRVSRGSSAFLKDTVAVQRWLLLRKCVTILFYSVAITLYNKAWAMNTFTACIILC